MRLLHKLACSSLLGLLLLSVQGAPVFAQDDSSVPDSDVEFMALLEFLGEFTAEDGRWIDPIQLVEELGDELADEQAQEGVDEPLPSLIEDDSDAPLVQPDAVLLVEPLTGLV